MPTGIYKRTEKTRDKMKESAKLRIQKFPYTKPNKPFKKGHPSYLTENSKRKMRENHKGMLGKKHTKETKIKIGNKSRGRNLGEK